MSFKNQIVWITGASSGLGRAMALEFAEKGAILAVSARRMELLEGLVEEIETLGGKARPFRCDVTDEANVAACVDAIVGDYGRLHVAVANAGYGVMGTLESLNAEDWQRQFAGNVTGLALTCKYALPQLRKSGGRLALVGSVAAFVPNPGIGAYGASKAAVHNIGETLQVELLGSGVSCTTIHPGFVDSNIARVDNHGVYHPDRADPRPANLMWPTAKAAKAMVDAIAQRRKVYVFTGHGKVIAWLGRYMPGVARKVMAKQMAEMAKAMVSKTSIAYHQ